MRQDMSKVMVERPRLGGGTRFPRPPLSDARLEELPRRQGIRRPWIQDGLQKGLNENLAPLRRYLLSNVGRPWCKVFSEVSQHMRLDSAVQLHIWQHLRWYVCLEAWRVGRDYVNSRGEVAHEPFVVDARSGLLRKNARSSWWRRRYRPHRSANNERIEIDELHEYRRVGGIWYLVTLAPLSSGCAAAWDVVRRKPVNELNREEIVERGGRQFYFAGKRQLNSKEIRRLPTMS